MRRWTRQTLRWIALAAGLSCAVIALPPQWFAAAAAAVAPPALPNLSLADRAPGRLALPAIGPNPSRQFECLALNIYWEAKSEPVTGKVAVAAVTLNRLVHPAFPDTICEVVKQGAKRASRGCQFSWVCDRRKDRPRDAAAWQLAREIAYQVLYLDRPDPTGGALYFHATYVRPAWARQMVKVGRIGRHIFYREPMTAENGSRRAPS